MLPGLAGWVWGKLLRLPQHSPSQPDDSSSTGTQTTPKRPTPAPALAGGRDAYVTSQDTYLMTSRRHIHPVSHLYIYPRRRLHVVTQPRLCCPRDHVLP